MKFEHITMKFKITVAFYLVLLSFCGAIVNISAAHSNQCHNFTKDAVNMALINWPSISLKDVESSVFENGFRVQRINDEWYISNHINPPIFNRNAITLLTLFSLGRNARIPNGLDFYLDISDSNFKSGPVVAFCSYNRSIGINVPDYSLLSWPDAGLQGTFNTLSKELVAIGERPKLSNNKVIFYGYMGPSRKKRVKGYSTEYAQIVDSYQKYAKNGQQKTFMPLTETCKHEYLLHLPGGISYSSRLKYLLLCNSTVIIVDDWVAKSIERGNDMHMLFEEWFYPALIPYVHYFPARNGDEINQAVQYLREHPAEARQIAHNGALFAQAITHHSCVMHYWQELLSEYRRRMTYKVTEPARGAVLLTNSLLLDVAVMQNRRNQKPSRSWVTWWNRLTHIEEDGEKGLI